MHAWLDALPIPKKLWLFNILTAAVAGMISALLLIFVVWYIEAEHAEREATLKATILAQNALPALQFRDTRTAEDILGGLAPDPEVLSARIREQDGTIFASYTPRPDATVLAGNRLRVSVPIGQGQDAMGELELVADMTALREKLATYIGAVMLSSVLALLIGGILIARLQRAITHPLTELTRVMHEVSAGHDFSRRAVIASHDELGQLSDSFNRMIEQVEQSNAALSLELAERRRTEERLEHLAHHDPVTGLPNRHFFRKRAGDLARGQAFSAGSVALLFIDLDNFKYINDTFGHDCGDQLLVGVAERLQASVRAHDMVVRFGGDEFIVLLDRIGDTAQALRLAQKILNTILQPFDIGSATFHVTCSIGAALAPEHAGTFDELLRKSDAAMYAAKSAGKNNVQLWDPAISEDSSTRFILESDLRLALARGELSMHYQPVIELQTGRIAGMEALMRWHHAQRGFVSPAEFIPIAEDTGLIDELGLWAMQEAFTQGARWSAQFGALFVAVNVSGRQLRNGDFPVRAEAIACKCGLPPEMRELEVTESIIMAQRDAVQLLESLSERGFGLALDDFGTGYSSLAYLKRFPLDKLKIDRSFVKDLPADRDDAAIAEAIVGLARTLAMRTVAEGIETAAQAEMLRELGCDLGQGYYFAKPMPAAQMEAFIADNRATLGARTS